jgi:hypothetical protein
MTDQKLSDPRVLALAKARQQITHENTTHAVPQWDGLSKGGQQIRLQEAAAWLRAAVEAGIAPLADRPTDKHEAVYVDDEGFLYGEYRTVPPSDSIVRLVWASEMAESKEDLEHHGVEFRLIGWSQ